MTGNRYTYFEDIGMYTCNDCGAHGEIIEAIKHHSTCNPGEAEKWEQYYAKEDKPLISDKDYQAYLDKSLDEDAEVFLQNAALAFGVPAHLMTDEDFLNEPDEPLAEQVRREVDRDLAWLTDLEYGQANLLEVKRSK